MLYTQALTTMPDDAKVLMAKEASVKRFVQRQRTKLIPMEPASIEDLVIDGEWAENANDTPQRFLIHDNGQNADSRIIEFASPTALRNLVVQAFYGKKGSTLNKLQQKLFLLF